MSFEFPVNVDQEFLHQFREELQWTNQELEMLAIDLERHPENMQNVEKLRLIIHESWMNSVKLELTPLSESLSDTLMALDLLLDWQVYPPRMTEFLLSMVDRLMLIAHEVEEHQFIDMRKTQAILVALQYIILAQNSQQFSHGIEDAIIAINQDLNVIHETVFTDDDIVLFGDDESASQIDTKGPEIFVPNVSLNPLEQARDFIKNQSNKDCVMMLSTISDNATQYHQSHTQFVLELALMVNFIAKQVVDPVSIYRGICLHDIALATHPELLNKKTKLSASEINELKQHPLHGSKIVQELSYSDETELLVLHHHEHLDGSGYPFGLQKDNISEQGKLAAIVDSFHEAMEKNAHLSLKKQILRGLYDIHQHAGRFYDPTWAKLFSDALREYWVPDLANRFRQAS